MMDKYTSRKFWCMMFWQAVFTFLVFKGVVTGDQYGNLTLITLGAYFAANVISKFAHNAEKPNDSGNFKAVE
jgi:hypothetical protein